MMRITAIIAITTFLSIFFNTSEVSRKHIIAMLNMAFNKKKPKTTHIKAGIIETKKFQPTFAEMHCAVMSVSMIAIIGTIPYLSLVLQFCRLSGYRSYFLFR